MQLGGNRGNLADLRKGPAKSAQVCSRQAAERAVKVRRQVEAAGIEGSSLRQIAAALNERLKELNAAGFIDKAPEGYVATPMGWRVHEQLVPLGITACEWAKALESPSE